MRPDYYLVVFYKNIKPDQLKILQATKKDSFGLLELDVSTPNGYMQSIICHTEDRGSADYQPIAAILDANGCFGVRLSLPNSWQHLKKSLVQLGYESWASKI